MKKGDPVVETYSKLADVYDDPANLDSCWGRVAEHSLSLISVRDTHRTVVDVGCGTGRELMKLVASVCFGHHHTSSLVIMGLAFPLVRKVQGQIV